MRILIIDDDPDARELLKQRLEEEEHEVLQAKDGLIGLERIHTDSPDVILLDLNMPVATGYDVLKALRNDPFSTDIPVIVLTGQEDLEALTESIRWGATDYLNKPYSTNELLNALNSATADPPEKPPEPKTANYLIVR